MLEYPNEKHFSSRLKYVLFGMVFPGTVFRPGLSNLLFLNLVT